MSAYVRDHFLLGFRTLVQGNIVSGFPVELCTCGKESHRCSGTTKRRSRTSSRLTWRHTGPPPSWVGDRSVDMRLGQRSATAQSRGDQRIAVRKSCLATYCLVFDACPWRNSTTSPSAWLGRLLPRVDLALPRQHPDNRCITRQRRGLIT